MLIQKGGIQRRINPMRFPHYKAKGYAAVDAVPELPQEAPGLEALTVPELEAFAQANGIDLAGAANKADKKARILEALEAKGAE